MDIAEFIEQDILIFLDDRLDSKPESSGKAGAATPTIFLTKDYEKDLLAALSQGNIVIAKQTLNTLKDELEICPPGPDKEHLKALLLALYEKFKDYIDVHHLSITDPELGLRSDPLQAPSPSPIATAVPAATAPPVVTPTANAQQTDTLQRVDALHKDIEEALERKDLEKAMQSYRLAKGLLAEQGAPKEIALQFITLFGRIRQLAVERRIHAVTATPPQSAPQNTAAQSMDHDLLLQIEREKHNLDAMLHRGDFAEAAAQYRRMRSIIQQMRDPAIAKPAAEKLQRIFEIIGSMQKHAAHNERSLSTVMP